MVDRMDIPDVVRECVGRQMGRSGAGESGPGLVRLRSADDGHVAEYARRELEKNPDPGATGALLEELASVEEAAWKIGLLNAQFSYSTAIGLFNNVVNMVILLSVTALSSRLSGKSLL